TYTIADGHGGTATASVALTISAENDAPAAANDTATTAEDTAVSIAVLSNDSDPDGDTLMVSSVGTATHGSAVVNPNGTVTYMPAVNYDGTDSFTYTLTDGHGGSATGTVSVSVTAVNDAPAAVNDTAMTAEDTAVAIAVLSNDTDPDGDTLSVTGVSAPPHGEAVLNANGTITYTPAANYNGTDAFTYTIADGHGGTAAASVALTITAENDAPAAGSDTTTTAEDTAVSIAVLTNDTDPDGDTLTVSAASAATHGTTLVNADGTITYTPAANYNGLDSFTYTIADGHGGSAAGTVNVSVTAVNDAPAAANDAPHDHLHAGVELRGCRQLHLHHQRRPWRDRDGDGQRHHDPGERCPGRCGRRRRDVRGHGSLHRGAGQRQRCGWRHPVRKWRRYAGARQRGHQREWNDHLHAGAELRGPGQRRLHHRRWARRQRHGDDQRDRDRRQRSAGRRRRCGNDDGRHGGRRRGAGQRHRR
ncbi:MAG: hypothetical protein DMF87_27580, partial [Acidobacteria bacterium]